jgi:F-type H+-transporting ATPase subunit delta
MATSVYANNLAKALFETALKEKEMVKWLGELRLVSDLAKDAAVSSVLQRTGTSINDKMQTLKDRAGNVSAQVLNAVGMLLEKGKLTDLEDVSIEYQRLLDSYHGVEGAEVAEVTTAVPLDENDMLDLGKKLTEIVGRPVVIKAKVDPAIVGGIRIMFGGKLIDATLRHRLDMLSKELV